MVRGQKEPYNPVLLNAKTGFVFGNECTICWAFVTNERTENHAKWHERQNNSTSEGEQDAGQEDTQQDDGEDFGEDFGQARTGKQASQRARRDPRSARGQDAQAH